MPPNEDLGVRSVGERSEEERRSHPNETAPARMPPIIPAPLGGVEQRALGVG